MTPRRPADLHAIPLAEVLPLGSSGPTLFVTMARGQWDGMLAAAYADGWVLLEIDENERPVRAYRREP